jgi:alkylation response protein AidB-like acyl-CoA dehydrogenase
MDLTYDDADLAFRAEVRGFLRENLPQRLRDWVQLAPSYVPKSEIVAWHKKLHEKGWVAPGWPEEHGGTGWSPVQRFLFEEEYQAADCPRISPFGVTMVGPVIYTFGSAEQKQRFLPKILSGDEFWCQGYSEPGAGSDLASLQTKAVRDGEDYIVNGHKIWTSHAHHADWMFCLVRTDSEAKPQAGISFLLIDMTRPGITLKPIISNDGGHYLNEVFLDDVRVPQANRIGEENKGWTYAKFLLGHERTGIAGVSKSKHKLARLKQIADVERSAGLSLISDPEFSARFSDVEVRLTALEYTNLRMMAALKAGQGPGPGSSTLKISGTQIEQDLNELMIEALNYYAAPYPDPEPKLDSNEPAIGPAYGSGLMREHLLRRAASIYGGSNEIQRNIIAKAVLEL